MKTIAPLVFITAFCVAVFAVAPWIITGFFKYADWVAGVMR